ncbi:DNA/RNA polymerase [Tilletiaria anomala UBC 951]|uniref:DNA-directed RNA polymerase n=1 Tax=Tilletiaria anomala (strain ATCC 24038 / CBS 436.72 / UBC 951) TaxID=1037660 RepID=A0A066WB02_TILAU|nr:DNA/RNA polymerase [Tilletiaria anomala UBC 951]KDN47945.1 DNA/RNA polymerase [Tilletiaria anomala UBC 951]
MLRVAGRRYDRRAPRRLAAGAISAPLSSQFVGTAVRHAATAAAAAVSVNHTASLDDYNHNQTPPRSHDAGGQLPSLSKRGSGTSHPSQPLFISNANRKTRLTRLPTPLPPETVDQHIKSSPFTRRNAASRTSAPASPSTTSSDATPQLNSDVYPAEQRHVLRSLFVHQAFYPTSQTIEDLAVLRTSLDAGLIWRAGKVFEGIRNEERSRWDSLERLIPQHHEANTEMSTWRASANSILQGQRLDKAMYEDMLSAYLFKAAAGENTEAKKEFIRRAIKLWEDMVQALSSSTGFTAAATTREGFAAREPPADARTAAIMLRGVGRLLRSWQPTLGAKPPFISMILPALQAHGVSLVDVLNSPVWSEFPPSWEAQITARARKAVETGEGTAAQDPQASVSGAKGAPSRAEVLSILIEEAKEQDDARIVSDLAALASRLSANGSKGGKEGRLAADMISTSHSRSEYSDEDALRPDERCDVPDLQPTLTTSPSSRYIPSEAAAEAPVDESTPGLPYNLHALQENLSAVAEARKRFSEPYARQRWFEGSAFEAARKRLRFSVEQMEKSGLKSVEMMGDKQLQRWMWDWYKALEVRLKADLEEMRILLEEDGQYQLRGSHVKGKNRSTASASAEEGGIPPAIKPKKAAEDAKDLFPLLTSIPVSQLALIPVLEIMRLLGTGGISDGMKTTRATVTIGRAVEEEKIAQSFKRRDAELKVSEGALGASSQASAAEEDSAIDAAMSSELVAAKTQRIMSEEDYTTPEARRKMRKLNEQSGMRGFWDKQDRWTQPMRARVGSYLVDELMKVATVKRSAKDREGRLWNEEHPAFYKSYQYLAGKRLGVVKVNDVVAQRLDRDTVRETLHPRRLPMLVPPRPWISHDQGGYYTESTSAMRFKDSAEQNSYLKLASDNGELDRVLAGLDVLGQTAWRINRKVFDVISEVWNTGEAVAKIPPRLVDVPEPVKPENYDTDMKAKNAYNMDVRRWAMTKAINHGMRCDINYKLEIARAFIGERFFQPHNMDFRGRAYPIPPNFNHMGNDMCRGLLKFDVAKPLGERGLRWLHIHLANLYGFDKASFSEREQWAKQHQAEVRESAANPLTGSRWWLNADDPWQCLATCFELVEAWDHPEGPEKYVSSLPVHQDGTCNGLQHYAALGGDLAGAKQVNLAGGDRPSDVYTGVADLVIDRLDEAAAQGDAIAQTLQGKVTRKVVKQTVMTTVYGVTFVGAKKQIARQLSERSDIPTDELWQISSYLAKLVLSQIGSLFSGATHIQKWLHHSARLIAKSIPADRVHHAISGQAVVSKKSRNADGVYIKSKGIVNKISKEQMTSVIWTTALGLPVVQPYRKSKKRQMSTRMQTVYINDPHINHEVSPKKQASAFPPNFIHSLDATHMILTALECHKAKLTFASVHDSYWTHACDIDTMSDFIRETFVMLHSNDILTKLRDEFLERFGDYKVPVFELKALAADGASLESSIASELLEPVNSILAKNLSGEEANLPIKLKSKQKQTAADSTSADAEEHEELEDVNDADSTESPATQSETVSKDEQLINAKFVALRDVLPPLPPKGTFDVNEIRESLYFFS